MILKTITAVLAIILLIFGIYVRMQYKKSKWLDGEALTSRKQSTVESIIALICFAGGLGLLYVYTNIL